MDVDPGYKYKEQISGDVQWYMMVSKDFIWIIRFGLKNKNAKLASFYGQSFTFRLSLQEVWKRTTLMFWNDKDIK